MDKNTEDKTLPIPDIPEELHQPVNSLLNTARLYQGIIAKAAEGTPIMEVLVEQRELIEIADLVIASWDKKLPED